MFLVIVCFQFFDGVYFRFKLGIVRISTLDIDCYFASPVAEYVVLVTHISIAYDNFTSLEVLFVHWVSKYDMLLIIQMPCQETFFEKFSEWFDILLRFLEYRGDKLL